MPIYTILSNYFIVYVTIILDYYYYYRMAFLSWRRKRMIRRYTIVTKYTGALVNNKCLLSPDKGKIKFAHHIIIFIYFYH